MSPRRIGFSTALTSCSRTARVLLEWDANYNLMFGDPSYFRGGSLNIWNMLKYFCAEYAIKRVIGDVKLGYIASNGRHSSNVEARLFEIEGSHRFEMSGQNPREMPVSRADVQDRVPPLWQNTDKIGGSSSFRFTCPVFLNISHKCSPAGAGRRSEQYLIIVATQYKNNGLATSVVDVEDLARVEPKNRQPSHPTRLYATSVAIEVRKRRFGESIGPPDCNVKRSEGSRVVLAIKGSWLPEILAFQSRIDHT